MATESAPCPACGYNPNPIEVPLSLRELEHQRVLNLFNKNLQNTWWLTQPEYICNFLKSIGVAPKNILDVGCGDGRFLAAIVKTFPSASYSGLDNNIDHIIINKENFPEYKWLCADIATYPVQECDCVFLMGIFNPVGIDIDSAGIIRWVKKAAPKDVIVLFDLHSKGINPSAALAPEYAPTHNAILPAYECGPFQNLLLTRFKRHESGQESARDRQENGKE